MLKQCSGILMVKVLQLLVEVRMEFLQILRPFKKALRRDGEELGGVFGGIRPQQRRFIFVNVTAQALVIFMKGPCPGDKGGTLLKDCAAVAFAVRAVELVGEFVEDDVVAIVNIGCIPADVIPGEHHGAMMPGFAEADVKPFFHDPAGKVPGFLCDVSRGINKYGAQAGIVIGLAMQKQDAGLSGDRYPDFVGNLEAAAAEETFFGQEYEDMASQFLFIGEGQFAIEGDVVIEDVSPIGGKRPGRDFISTPFFEEEHK